MISVRSVSHCIFMFFPTVSEITYKVHCIFQFHSIHEIMCYILITDITKSKQYIKVTINSEHCNAIYKVTLISHVSGVNRHGWLAEGEVGRNDLLPSPSMSISLAPFVNSVTFTSSPLIISLCRFHFTWT